MNRRIAILVTAIVVLPACDGCDGCRSESTDAAVETVEVNPTPTITQINRRHAGEPLSAAAVHPDGRVALFGQSGAFAITQMLDPTAEDPTTATTESPVMDAGWIENRVVGLETAPAALVLWEGEDEVARVLLEGAAVDLLVDPDHAAAWVVLRGEEGATVRAFAVSGESLEPRVDHTIGAQPVGLWAGFGSVYAPTFLDRTITVFSAADFNWTGSIPVRERPLAIHPTPEGPAVIGANAAVVQIANPDAHRFVEMPTPHWIVEEQGKTYAFAAGDSVLRRLDNASFELRAENTELGLVRGIATSALGLVSIDAGDEPSVALLDPDTLEVIVATRAEGRPDRVVATSSGAFVVISPAEGVVVSYRAELVD